MHSIERKGNHAMIQEFEQVVFTVDLPEYHLLTGDVGTVADIHMSGKAYEVEVFRVDGSTLGVFTVSSGMTFASQASFSLGSLFTPNCAMKSAGFWRMYALQIVAPTR